MLKIDTVLENTVSRSPGRGPFIVCAALWQKPAAMMSNKEPSSTVAACIREHTKRFVDTWPTIAKAIVVSRHPHGEEFDIGARQGRIEVVY
jgi:hypothetical protein